MIYAMLAVLSLTSTTSTFDEYMALRNFEHARQEAQGSDSLEAVVFRGAGNYTIASLLFEKAFGKEPSPGLFVLIWETVSASSDHNTSMSAQYLRDQLKQWDRIFSWEPDHLLSLVESAEALGDSSLSDSLFHALLQEFPGSPEASEAIGWAFYDGLYPVWYDDSARIIVLHQFLEDYGDCSDLWRSRAWQYTLAAVTQTADSSEWTDYLEHWLESCPNDPVPCLSGAAFYIDRDSSWREALDLADLGLSMMEEERIPVGMVREEWMITSPALESGLRFRRCFALAGLDSVPLALEELDTMLSDPVFTVDDHHTEAPMYWLQGILHLRSADTLEAMTSFLKAASLGDIRDLWSGKAVQALDSLLPTGVTPEEWSRDASGYGGPVFSDVTGWLTPDSVHSGSRISWCDQNSDGYPDLFVGSSLYRNRGGTCFEDVTSSIGLDSCQGNGGIWGDLDNNGFPDLVTSGHTVQVWFNYGEYMVNRTRESGIAQAGSSIEGVALLDWNADGWLDLYLAAYEESGNMGSGTHDIFYLGGPNGFHDSTDSLAMIPFRGEPLCGRGVSPCDFDRDGDMDIFVSDYRLQENLLWENRDRTAENTALELGTAGYETQGWWGHTIGSAWSDFDRDGDWDLFSANLAHPRYISVSDRSQLLENIDGGFRDIRDICGIKYEETHSNPVWGDFNNDGWPDLYITSIYENRRSFLYMNLGADGFRDVTWLSGSRVFNGWGAAVADFDLDGRLDLAVGSSNGVTLLRNITPGGHWVLFRVAPYAGVNSSCIGCTVELEQDGVIHLRQVEGGSGTTSQNSEVLHFGLNSENQFSIKLYVPGSTDCVFESEGLPDSLMTIGP